MTTDADVVVIGAGLAGLQAARLLTRGGAKVIVVEARDRVGGRTWSRPIGGGTFDLGGQWIGPTQHRANALARELGIATFATYSTGVKLMETGGKLRRYRGSIPSLSIPNLLVMHRAMRRADREAGRVRIDRPWDAPRAADFDSESLETWKRRLIPTRQVREAFDVAVRVVFGAEPAELSLLWFLAYVSASGGLRQLIEIEGGAQQDRFVGGAQTLSTKLAAELQVLLSSPVTRIAHGADGVTIHVAGGRELRARRVVIAIPPALAAKIAFDPPLPAQREQLVQRMPMGATTKIIATYARPFWRAAGLSGEAISGAGPLTVTFDNTSHDGAQPALVGFVVGRHARGLLLRPESERRAAVLSHLVKLFGREAAQPTNFVEQDWQAEPWTRGCPVGSFAPGAMLDFAPALRATIGAIHFAGTETAAEWTGYLEGALESAERASREVLTALGASKGA
jgi:monoamine oxidase